MKVWVDHMSFKEILEEACFDIDGGEKISKLNYWLFYLGAFDWIYVVFQWISEGRIHLVSAYFDLWKYTFAGLPPGMEVLSFIAVVTQGIAFLLFLNLGVTIWRIIKIFIVIQDRKNES